MRKSLALKREGQSQKKLTLFRIKMAELGKKGNSDSAIPREVSDLEGDLQRMHVLGDICRLEPLYKKKESLRLRPKSWRSNLQGNLSRPSWKKE